MELNPNHPVTQQVSDQWHTICAVLMAKFGITHVVITAEDVSKLQQGTGIVFQELKDGVHLTVVDAEQAKEIASKAGGLPS